MKMTSLAISIIHYSGYLRVKNTLLPKQLHTSLSQALSLKASMPAKAAQVRSGLSVPGHMTTRSYGSLMSSRGNSTQSKTPL